MEANRVTVVSSGTIKCVFVEDKLNANMKAQLKIYWSVFMLFKMLPLSKSKLKTTTDSCLFVNFWDFSTHISKVLVQQLDVSVQHFEAQ